MWNYVCNTHRYVFRCLSYSPTSRRWGADPTTRSYRSTTANRLECPTPCSLAQRKHRYDYRTYFDGLYSWIAGPGRQYSGITDVFPSSLRIVTNATILMTGLYENEIVHSRERLAWRRHIGSLAEIMPCQYPLFQYACTCPISDQTWVAHRYEQEICNAQFNDI